MNDQVYWYRVVDGRYAPSLNEWGEVVGRGRSYAEVRKYPVISDTPKGVWLDDYGRKRFVRRDARRHWACPTVEEAYKSFFARKRKQARILRSQLEHVEEVLAVATHTGEPPK